jgi:hypothetical protein
MDCPLKYAGQTGETFCKRHKEHEDENRNNNGNSGYSNHILSTECTYGSITDTMNIIKTEEKGKP